MRQVNRKPKSLEMMLGEHRAVSAPRPGTDDHIHQQIGNFTTSGLDGGNLFLSLAFILLRASSACFCICRRG